MANYIFAPGIGVPSAASRERFAGVIDIPILKEKEVGSAIASRLRKYFISEPASTAAVKRSVLAVLAGNIVFDHMIGYASNVAVNGNKV